MNNIQLLKKSVLLLLIPIFILASCKKDDDSDGKNKELIGKWTITSSESEITINGTDIVEFFMTELELSQSDAEMYAALFDYDMSGTIEFKSDGTYETITDGDTDNGTWELNGDILTLDKGTGDEVDADVITLTSSQLVFEISETDSSGDIDEDGTNDTMVIKIKLTCSK